MPDMAWVAQLAERLIVVQEVVGSNPTPRPELIDPRFKKAPVKWLNRGAILEKENREGQP